MKTMPTTDSSAAMEPAPAVVALKRILVTTDFSEASRQALPLAVAFARQFHATLSLVHVFPITWPAELNHLGIVWEQERLAAEAGQRLAGFREQELPANLPVETILLKGGPGHEISKFAKYSEVDLIVAAPHGYSGFRQFWIGSTAERIVRHAPCPVLVVREQPVPMRFPGDVLCRFQHILVPTDFSKASHQALHYAVAFARPCASDVALVHVIEPPPYPEFGYAHIPAKEAALTREVFEKLEEPCQELGRAGIKATPVIRKGSAAHEIAAQAREQSSDLIVIATHGRGAIARALLGSTAERVVRHAPCPVLVVREKERDFVAD